ncbi:MAG: hypothetical protein Q8R02_09345 [Hyphomonadaceae bacterium]|nr:hypothetical protein [Hyphomonadaceae bacterium]
MADRKISKEMTAELVRAGIYEALCFGAGVIGLYATGKVIWIVIGIVAGLGFTVPAIIKLIREVKERDRASR